MSEKEYKTTEAQRRANAKYSEKFERINCRLDAGTIARIAESGESANGFIRIAVNERLNRLGIPNTNNE